MASDSTGKHPCLRDYCAAIRKQNWHQVTASLGQTSLVALENKSIMQNYAKTHFLGELIQEQVVSQQGSLQISCHVFLFPFSYLNLSIYNVCVYEHILSTVLALMNPGHHYGIFSSPLSPQ